MRNILGINVGDTITAPAPAGHIRTGVVTHIGCDRKTGKTILGFDLKTNVTTKLSYWCFLENATRVPV